MTPFRARPKLAWLAAAGALALALAAHHAWLAPLLGMKDGANRVVCCFDPAGGGLATSPDGQWASQGGRVVDLQRGEIVTAPGPDVRLRAAWSAALNSGSAWFGPEASPRRVAAFTAAKPLSVHLHDGTEIALSNPNGNCVVIADDGPIAAVVVSRPDRPLLDYVLPMRSAGTIDFVDLRSGRTLRSVTVARLDGFACASGKAAALVGVAGGSRWVLAQERWIKILEVRVPAPMREPTRALARATTGSATF